METIDIYAIAAGGIFASLILMRLMSYLSRFTSTVSVLFGPWTRFDVLAHFLYIAVNVFCLYFPHLLASDAGRRAGLLALVNMIFLFAGLHLSFVADLLGISLQKCRGFHRAAGWMVTGLGAVHAVVMATETAYPLDDSKHVFAIIGVASLGVLSLFLLPCFHHIAYEIFLRAHQITACICIYAVWCHLPSHTISAWLYIYTGIGICLLTFVTQVVIFVYRNSVFAPQGCPRALVTYMGRNNDDNNMDNCGVKPLKVLVTLPRPLSVHPGQYISLRMPAVSWWSWTQSHPFMVASWSQGKQSTLELLVQPRRGLTADLVRHTHAMSGVSFSFPAFITGPHGTTEPVSRYETVILVASGFGVAAVIPYLKKLIHGYNTNTFRTRRVHFIWQLQAPDIAVAVQPWLNELLKDDVLDNGYILSISIYLESGEMATEKLLFGDHERAVVYRRPPNIQKVLQAEIAGEYIERLPNIQEERGEVLVMASLCNKLRDHLRGIIRGHLQDKVRMTELEFQPEHDEK